MQGLPNKGQRVPHCNDTDLACAGDAIIGRALEIPLEITQMAMERAMTLDDIGW